MNRRKGVVSTESAFKVDGRLEEVHVLSSIEACSTGGVVCCSVGERTEASEQRRRKSQRRERRNESDEEGEICSHEVHHALNSLHFVLRRSLQVLPA